MDLHYNILSKKLVARDATSHYLAEGSNVQTFKVHKSNVLFRAELRYRWHRNCSIATAANYPSLPFSLRRHHHSRGHLTSYPPLSGHRRGHLPGAVMLLTRHSLCLCCHRLAAGSLLWHLIAIITVLIAASSCHWCFDFYASGEQTIWAVPKKN